MKSAPWAKLWWDWYVTRSHAELGGVALALGPVLMLLGRASPRNSYASGDALGDGMSDGVWIVTSNGRPVTSKYLAGVVRFHIDDVEAALRELVDAGTICVRADGAYGFPNFWRYQETSAAARMRKHRTPDTRNCYASSDAPGDDKRREVRGERSEEGERASAPPPQPLGPPPAVADAVRAADLVPPRFDVAVPTKPANDQLRQTTAPQIQEFDEILRAEAFELKFKPAPQLFDSVRRKAVNRAADIAAEDGLSFPAACRLLVSTALQEARNLSKGVGLVILDCEPGKPKQARANGFVDATLKPAPASAFDSTSLLKFIEGDGYDHLDAKGDPR